MMTNHATGTFDIDIKFMPEDDKSIGRMTSDKQFHGDLEGTSKGYGLYANTEIETSRAYVAFEKFTGSVKGRKGTFILMHSATGSRGESQLNITVVPDSGTGELTGI
ncbi:MAG TPA: DUF3224 domain-containing protein, partial [Blastocatellia bacterium]|nr:DUF3224 domain-containing protein [Blastocatellia bacterium]